MLAATAGTSTYYLYGLGRIGGQQTAGWAYHLPDVLSSERQLTNSAGNVIQARSYQPFGSVLGSAGAATTVYGFTGEWTDGTGLGDRGWRCESNG